MYMLCAGNIEQTRTIANEMLSGLVIDLLSHIQDSLGCTFKFYYPCARLNGTATTCNARDYSSVQSGLTMLDTARIDEDKYGLDGYENLKAQQDADDDVYYGGGPGLCPDNRCFVAANVAITAERMTRYFMTQPFLYKGFTLVVNSGDLKADFFSWMYPFVHFVWMLTVGVITVSTFAFCICEGYGVGNSLSEYKRNPFLLIIQSLQWSILLLLGAASRQPVTHAGRTLVMANLFFVVLWISVYTGNLNQFLLSVPYQTKVNRIEDFDPIKRTSMFSSRNTVCVPQQHPSVDSFLRILEEGYAGETIPRVNGTDLYDCLTKVPNCQRIYLYKILNAFFSMLRTARVLRRASCVQNLGRFIPARQLQPCSTSQSSWMSSKRDFLILATVDRQGASVRMVSFVIPSQVGGARAGEGVAEGVVEILQAKQEKKSNKCLRHSRSLIRPTPPKRGALQYPVTFSPQ